MNKNAERVITRYYYLPLIRPSKLSLCSASAPWVPFKPLAVPFSLICLISWMVEMPSLKSIDLISYDSDLQGKPLLNSAKNIKFSTNLGRIKMETKKKKRHYSFWMSSLFCQGKCQKSEILKKKKNKQRFFSYFTLHPSELKSLCQAKSQKLKSVQFSNKQ